MKIKSMIPGDERGKCRCHFCGETYAKYIVEVFDPVVDNKLTDIYCCNKCVITKAEEKRNLG